MVYILITSGTISTGPQYSSGVLLGDWFDQRTEYRKQPVDYCTVNQLAYSPKTADVKSYDNIRWDNRIKMEGVDPFLLYDEGPCYSENMTSSYTLQYEILPKGLCGPLPRRYSSKTCGYLPQPEYLRSYGNLTQFGLVDSKREIKWDHPPRTTAQEDYKPYDAKSYLETKRRVSPSVFGSTISKNSQMKDLKLRGLDLKIIPEGPVDLSYYESRMLASPQLRKFLMKPQSG